MLKLLSGDWAQYLFEMISLRIYEKEQENHRKVKELQKNKIIKNNRIIVKVNDELIYDSKKEKEMSDELYCALLSYGLLETVKQQNRNRKTPISYSLYPTISTLPVVEEKVV